ncbi:MAG: AAA family ATPase [Promethearchaeota archaeon]
MNVIAICGLPGSGKTTAIDAVKDLGIVVTMGDVVRNEVSKRNLEPSAINIGKVAEELRREGGSAIIAEKCVELIKFLNKKVVIVDGVRSLSEVEIFRKFWKFPIIAIVVNDKLRFKRLFKRHRSDDPVSLEELKQRDKREIGFGLNKLIESADYIIKNDSNIEKLKKRIRKVFLKIINFN